MIRPFRTRDLVTLRDLRRDEGGLLDTLMDGLSPQSRYLRFHSPVPALTASARRALLDVDGHDRIALVAEAGDGAPIGIDRRAAADGPGAPGERRGARAVPQHLPALFHPPRRRRRDPGDRARRAAEWTITMDDILADLTGRAA